MFQENEYRFGECRNEDVHGNKRGFVFDRPGFKLTDKEVVQLIHHHMDEWHAKYEKRMTKVETLLTTLQTSQEQGFHELNTKMQQMLVLLFEQQNQQKQQKKQEIDVLDVLVNAMIQQDEQVLQEDEETEVATLLSNRIKAIVQQDEQEEDFLRQEEAELAAFLSARNKDKTNETKDD